MALYVQEVETYSGKLKAPGAMASNTCVMKLFLMSLNTAELRQASDGFSSTLAAQAVSWLTCVASVREALNPSQSWHTRQRLRTALGSETFGGRAGD